MGLLNYKKHAERSVFRFISVFGLFPTYVGNVRDVESPAWSE